MGKFGQEKPQFPAPGGNGASDTRPIMKPKDLGRQVRKFQDPGAAIEALVHWDELADADLREIAADPHLSPRLEALKAAEAWLQAGGAAFDGCPSAEELYDYGGGPGSAPLPAEVTRRIDDHLFGCTACEELLLTLADAPPSPLVLAPPAATVTAPRRREPPALAPILELTGRTRRRRIQRVALACAASLVAAFALWTLFDGRESSLQLPEAPLLRGGTELALDYPRGPVLEPESWMPAAGLPLRFELRPVAEAESYRVEILRHTGGAFDAGTRVTELRGALGDLRLDARLPSGSYTWQAFATVHGLERELGSRDFEVRADAALHERLAKAAGSDELARTAERIRILHEAGDWTDARELARTLPPSSEREHYLEALPGR
jgi:hypothetical protein